MRRAGVTLVELLFALALAAALVAAYFTVSSAGARQGAQVERGAELMGAATILQEALSWDLLRSLPIGVLPEELAPRPGSAGAARFTLPLMAGYDPGATPSAAFRPLTYEFDPAHGVLRRNGQVLLGEGLAAVTFGWVQGCPDLLEVTLTGRSAFGVEGPRFVIRLPAPAGRRAGGSYRFAAHHAGARAEGSP